MNRLNKHLVYIAGPIEDMEDWGRGWREIIIPELRKRRLGILNPLDKPIVGLESEEDMILKKATLLQAKQYDELAALMKTNVVRPDLHMIDHAHFLIVYIDRDVHMAGTYSELTTAALQRKPTLIMCKQGIDKIPGWWWGMIPREFFFESWDDLLNYIDMVDQSTEPMKFWRFFDMEKIYGTFT